MLQVVFRIVLRARRKLARSVRRRRRRRRRHRRMNSFSVRSQTRLEVKDLCADVTRELPGFAHAMRCRHVMT